MTMTFLQIVQWPLAYLSGYVAGVIARRRRLPWLEAYALALVPGLLIAIASLVFGASFASGNEQPWQGLLIWTSWTGLGMLGGTRSPRRNRMTTLGLSGRGPHSDLM